MARPLLTKPRLEAIINTLTEALIDEPPGKFPDHEGALKWAMAYKARIYHEKEAQPCD
jgi:hypothetical protein